MSKTKLKEQYRPVEVVKATGVHVVRARLGQARAAHHALRLLCSPPLEGVLQPLHALQDFGIPLHTVEKLLSESFASCFDKEGQCFVQDRCLLTDRSMRWTLHCQEVMHICSGARQY